MAYAATVTSSYDSEQNRTTIKVVETGASSTSQWDTRGTGSGVTVSGLAVNIPQAGIITHYQSVLVSGTGTTITPRLGKATAWAANGIDDITSRDTAVAFHNTSVPVSFSFAPGQAHTIFGKSVVSAGSDNAITTILTICEQGAT